MTPAVDDMSVKEERACLSEIRESNDEMTYNHILHNGWTAGHFALKYVTGHYRKRKNKEKNFDNYVLNEADYDAGNVSELQHRKDEEAMYIRNPFSARPRTARNAHSKQTKRTQRYRSTAKSRILGMTVGDIRYCFQQLRQAGDNLTPNLVLYNGQCAGEFALCYLIETSNSMRNRRKRECSIAKEKADNHDIVLYPQSQIPQTNETGKTHAPSYGKVKFS